MIVLAFPCSRCPCLSAELFPGRSDVQCLHRWQKVLNPEVVKGSWTKEVSPAARMFPSLAMMCHLCTCASMHPGVCRPLVVLSGLGGGQGSREHTWRPRHAPCLEAGVLDPQFCLSGCALGVPFPVGSQEDDKVVNLIARYGTSKWSLIASHLPGRIGKQCRER